MCLQKKRKQEKSLVDLNSFNIFIILLSHVKQIVNLSYKKDWNQSLSTLFSIQEKKLMILFYHQRFSSVSYSILQLNIQK